MTRKMTGKRQRILALMLLLTLAAAGVTQAAPPQQDTEAYGWVGAVYSYDRPASDDYFVRNDGEVYGIAGQTAAVEQQILDLRGRLVKVWGTLREDAPDFNDRQIVVSEIAAVGGEATPVPVTETAPEALIRGNVVNVRTGPSTTYPAITKVFGEEIYDIVGRNEASTWWQICCPAGRALWIYSGLVEATGPFAEVAVVPVAPSPAPAPTPAPTPQPIPVITEWLGEYYPHLELKGTPALVRNDRAIDFNWGDKPPAFGLQADDFSIRWTRTVHFDQGDYRFVANADDGIRVWLDDWLIIDQWHAGPTSNSADFGNVGEGPHTVKVEYYEHLGDAAVNVWWQRTDIYHHWRGEYYWDIYLDPPPVLVRDDAAIDFNWGLGSPGPGLPDDNFSMRWTRSLYLSAGDYRFTIEGGDGARLRLDDWLVIDNWLKDTQHTFEGEFRGVGTGHHLVQVEWYSRGGIATVKMQWDRIQQEGGPQPD
jgi:uncharacterized protein YgiM (DUF1202 family)